MIKFVPDMIQFVHVPPDYNPRQQRVDAQEAEDLFWSAAVLWKHFGTSGNRYFDDRFDAERRAVLDEQAVQKAVR